MKITLTLNSKGLVDRIKKDKAALGWLDAIEKPVVSDSFLPVISNYKEGTAVSDKVTVVIPSGQQWQAMNQDEKEELLELVELTGIKAEDFVRRMVSMLPQNPRRK